jgi:hypothetical protein
MPNNLDHLSTRRWKKLLSFRKLGTTRFNEKQVADNNH